MSASKTSSPVRGTVRLGIVDDHPLFRVGLEQALTEQDSVRVVWSVAAGEEALRRLVEAPVDAVLMDVTLKGPMDGVTAAAAIHRDHPAVKVIMMSALAGDDVLIGALRARAVGYLSKELRPEDFVAAVHALVQPSAPLLVVHNLLDRFRRRQLASDAGTVRPEQQDGRLSPRETEVLFYVRDGRTNREIASRLGISRPTVDKHVQQILRKLNARNRAHAITVASGSGFERPTKMVTSNH